MHGEWIYFARLQYGSLREVTSRRTSARDLDLRVLFMVLSK